MFQRICSIFGASFLQRVVSIFLLSFVASSGFAIDCYIDADQDNHPGDVKIGRPLGTCPSAGGIQYTVGIFPGFEDGCDAPGVICDCNDDNAGISYFQNEICYDGIDNDCNGEADGNTCGYYEKYCDKDGDGYIGQFVYYCQGSPLCVPVGCVSSTVQNVPGNDCYDIPGTTGYNINPGVIQDFCDAYDNNCDGVNGETETRYNQACDGADADSCIGGILKCSYISENIPSQQKCTDNNFNNTTLTPPELNACGTCGLAPLEVCGNSVDEDCDGALDNGCAGICNATITNPSNPYFYYDGSLLPSPLCTIGSSSTPTAMTNGNGQSMLVRSCTTNNGGSTCSLPIHSCGDGSIDANNGEVCDGGVGVNTCQNYTANSIYTTGILLCTQCQFDISSCTTGVTLPPVVINGACGSADTTLINGAFSSLSASQLCTQGSSVNVVTNTNATPAYTWSCQGSGVGATSSSCTAHQPLSCTDITQTYILGGFSGIPNRTNPYRQESFVLQAQKSSPSQGVIQAMQLTGCTMSGASMLLCPGIAQNGNYNGTVTIGYPNTVYTQSCPHIVTVQDYIFTKTTNATTIDYGTSAIYTGVIVPKVTYTINAYIPLGATTTTIRDMISVTTTGQYTGLAHILTNTISLPNAYTVASVTPVTTVFNGQIINKGFELQVSGNPGYFTMTYTAELVDNSAGGVCNACEISANLTPGIYPIASIMPWYVNILDTVNAQLVVVDTANSQVCISLDLGAPICGTQLNTCAPNNNVISGPVVTCGTTPTWQCQKGNQKVSCTGLITPCGVPVTCGTTAFTCSDGSVGVNQTNPSCPQAKTWKCGTNNCTLDNACPVNPLCNGICGTANCPACACIGSPSINTQLCAGAPAPTNNTTSLTLNTGCTALLKACDYGCIAGTTLVGGQCIGPSCTALPITGLGSGEVYTFCILPDGGATIPGAATQSTSVTQCNLNSPACSYIKKCADTYEYIGGICVKESGITKICEGIVEDTATYTVTANFAPDNGTQQRFFKITDVMLATSGALSNMLFPTTFTSTDLTCTIDPQNIITCTEKKVGKGGSVTYQVSVNNSKGGSDETKNTVTMTPVAIQMGAPDSSNTGPAPRIATASCKGYTLKIDKTALPVYTTLNNTYPTSIAAGKIDIGDRVAYNVKVTNPGPANAFNLKISDIIPSGMEIIDLVGDETNFTRNKDNISYLGGASFIVGATKEFTFLSKLISGTTGSQVCNAATAVADNPPGFNGTVQDDACLTIDCGIRQCKGELTGTDWKTTTTATSMSQDGFCVTQGNCGMSDRFATKTANLEYKTYTAEFTQDLAGNVHLPNMPTETCGVVECETAGGISTTNTVENVLTNLLNGYNKDAFGTSQGMISGGSIKIDTDKKTLTFDYRCGQTEITCGKQTCNASDDMNGKWKMEVTGWKTVAPVPTLQNSDLTATGTCNTCPPGGPGGPGGPTCVGPTCTDPGCPSGVKYNGSCVPCGDKLECMCPCTTGSLQLSGVTVVYNTSNNTYSVTVKEKRCGLPGGPKTPIPPYIDVDGDGIANECTCLTGTTYCPADLSCKPNNETCGPDYTKVVKNISGSTITYLITASLASGGSQEIDDIVKNAYFDFDNVIFTVVQGSGTFFKTNIQDDGKEDIIFQITNTGTGVLKYTIEYKVFAGTSFASKVPVCNSADFGSGKIVKACACPTGTNYCAADDTCKNPGEPCIPAKNINKEIVGVQGNIISYKITGYASGALLPITYIDTISGAVYNPASATFSVGSGTFTFNTNTANILITSTVAERFEFRYSTTVTIPNRSMTGAIAPVCNQVTKKDSTNPNDSDKECTCPTGGTYCPTANICVPTGQACPNTCTGLTVSTGTILSGQVQGTYSCKGTGSIYNVVITNASGATVAVYTTKNGTYTVPTTGAYILTCYIDGDAGAQMCNDTLLSQSKANTIFATALPSIKAISSLSSVNRSTFNYSIPQSYILYSRNQMTALIAGDIYAYLLSQQTLVSSTTSPLVLPNTLRTTIQAILDKEFALQCKNLCEKSIVNACTRDAECPTGQVCINGTCDLCGNGVVDPTEICDPKNPTDPQAPQCKQCKHYETCDIMTYTGIIKKTDGTPTTVTFTCGLTGSTATGAVVLSCNNGTGTNPSATGNVVYTGTGKVVGVCTYNILGEYKATCTYTGAIAKTCEQPISLTVGGGGSTTNNGGGFCGDGVKNGSETCDFGMKDGKTRNDGVTLVDGAVCPATCMVGGGSTTNNGGTTSNGGGSGPITFGSTGGGTSAGSRVGTTPPLCAYIDPPSVMIGEYMPFRWGIEKSTAIVASNKANDAVDICAGVAAGSIPSSSLQCTFALYNGSNGSKNQEIPIWKETLPCLTKGRYDPTTKQEVSTAKLFDSVLPPSDTSAIGKAFIKFDQKYATTLGEYQIQLDEITYKVCKGEAQGDKNGVIEQKSNTRVCAMNIAVTDNYMIEKGTTLTTVASNILASFKTLGGSLVLNQPVPVKGFEKKDVNFFMNEFVSRYKDKATKNVSSIAGTSLKVSAGLKQVPGSEMYIYDAGDLTIDSILVDPSKPFTLIVTNGSLRIVGSLDSSAMFIVPNGTISFINKNCQNTLVARDQGYKDTVSGIFMAKEGFDAPVIANTDKNKNRCYEGGLVVKGILMTQATNGIETLVQAKRSSLNSWFDTGSSSKELKLLDGASVRIEVNTKLRSLLPPGATEMIKSLKVSK